jgi:hypothetical protein
MRRGHQLFRVQGGKASGLPYLDFSAKLPEASVEMALMLWLDWVT